MEKLRVEFLKHRDTHRVNCNEDWVIIDKFRCQNIVTSSHGAQPEWFNIHPRLSNVIDYYHSVWMGAN